MRMAATVSGSFHRHMSAISEAVQALHEAHVRVLSPADPRVVDAVGAFLFVASDRHRSVRLVEDRHLAAICASNFLWLVSPDGYVGQSAAMEIGFAVARDIPIFSSHLPSDLTLRQYVHRVESIAEALQLAVPQTDLFRQMPNLLIDPDIATDMAHSYIDDARRLLIGRGIQKEFSRELLEKRELLANILTLPKPK